MILCRKKTVNGVATTEYLLLGRKKTENDVSYVQPLSFDRKKSRLPNEYQEVEYLESHGTEWIDTGYVPNSNSSFELELEFTQYNTNYWKVYGCATTNYTSLDSVFLERVISGGRLNNYWFGQSATSFTTTTNYKYLIQTSSTSMSVYHDGVLLETVERTLPSAFATPTKNLYLFTINGTEMVQGAISSKVYLFNIYNNSILVRNFIPCYRKSDNEPGMYDLVNNQFYTNQGTGTFTVGPNKYIIQ